MRVHQWRSISELGTIIDFRGNLRDLLDHEFADQARMPSGPARHEMNPFDAPRLGGTEANIFQRNLPVFQRDSAAKSIGHRSRLLMDFFEHKMTVAAFARCHRVPSNLLKRPLDRLSLTVKNTKRID